MDLTQLAESKFKPQGQPILGLQAAGRVHSLVGSERHTEPLLATFFWQILKSSSVYQHALQLANASPMAAQQAETIVVGHGPDYNARYDLVVLDPAYPNAEPTAIHLDHLDPHDLSAGWERWQAQTLSRLRDAAMAGYNRAAEDFQRSLELVSALDPKFASEALDTNQFGIIVARQPLLERTSVPSPCWSLAPSPGGASVSTVGAIVTDLGGRTGVTVALHSLLTTLPSVVAGATQVEIDTGNGRYLGTIASVDQISDSAFVEVPSLPTPASPRGSRGRLRGVSPRVNEKVSFEGLSSGSKTTTTTGFSPDVPIVLPYSQLKVFTTPTTSPGDSGAALLDSDDRLLGFSFYRTGLGEPIEFSAWIWADSVYAAHNLA